MKQRAAMLPTETTGSAEVPGLSECQISLWSGVQQKHAGSGREKADIHLYKYFILAADKQEIHIQIFSSQFCNSGIYFEYFD